MTKVQFFEEDILFKESQEEYVISWIEQTIQKEGRDLESLNIIFCSDDYLLDINKQYLEHDYYTDIITFDNSDSDDIEGDLFISIGRVRNNSEQQNIAFPTELHRVIIHGVLHLLGYGDKTKEDKIEMRKKENTYLALLDD